MLNKNVILLFIVILSISLGIGFGSFIFNNDYSQDNLIVPADSVTKHIPIVGVTNDGNGVYGDMVVEVKPGTGLVLVNINDLLADYESQLSARNAALIAQNITGVSLYNKDIIYKIDVNASVVAGPSAGVAMAVATIAALNNKKVRDGIFITGAIDSNGFISSVGSIDKKAQAAKNGNASIFIIPKANYAGNYEMSKGCSIIRNINYCEISYMLNTNMTKLYGINIIEVKNIKEAIEVALE